MARRHTLPTLAPDLVLAALAPHVGAVNGTTCARLACRVFGLLETTPQAERAVRNAIVELRMRGQHICGTPDTGYFMAKTAAELDDTCRWLTDRAMTTLTQVSRMRGVAMPDLYGQLKIPT